MSREQALARLRSQSSNERYIAAKALIRLCQPGDLRELMICRKNESNAYVRRWMNYAIEACEKRTSVTFGVPVEEVSQMDVSGASSEERERSRTGTVESIAGALLHEIGSKIGLLMSSARREFPAFPGSDTERHVMNLVRIFEGISELRKAATPPKATEFDLGELIGEIVAVEAGEADIDVSFVGRKPLTIIADPDLLRLALGNGIRNAVEAVQSVEALEAHRIVIAWEITDKEYWISVIDHGPGVVGRVDRLFEIGRTNKTGHAGLGLAIARQAMERLGGDVSLAPSTGGGTKYEIRGALIR